MIDEADLGSGGERRAMIRLEFLMFLVLPGFLIAGLWGCSSSSPSGSSTPVSLSFEAPSSGPSVRQSEAAVPAGVASIRLDVSAGDMGTVTHAFNVSLGETVTLTFDIPSGPGRVFTVNAFDKPDAGGTALYGGVSNPLDLIPGVPISVTVSMQALLLSVAVIPSNPSIAAGLTKPFFASGTYGDNSQKDLTNTVTWSSSAPATASIDGAGLATGLSVGTTTIQAIDPSSGFGGTSVLTVTPAELVSISVTPGSPSIPLDSSQQFIATGSYTDGSSSDLTAAVSWSSSDTSVATIDALGLATGGKIGFSVISAVAEGQTGTATLLITSHISRLSLTQGVIGDSIKITGYGFGKSQGTNNALIGGFVATPILRWSDTEVLAVVPSFVSTNSPGVPTPVYIRAGGQNSNFVTILLQDHINGIGGEDDDGNLDKLRQNAPSPGLTVTDLSGTGFGFTSSVALSGDSTTAMEADTGFYSTGSERILNFDTGSPILDQPFTSAPGTLLTGRDVALSRDGSVALLADGSDTLILLTDFNGPNPDRTNLFRSVGVCLYEVALSSDGNTAAVIGEDGFCDGGAFHVYRIDNLLTDPVFTPVSDAGPTSIYTDVAISEDGKTVLIGKLNAGSAGVDRVTDFNTAAPVVRTDQEALAGCSFGANTVDVDLSADGTTGIAGIAGCGNGSIVFIVTYPVFQILDADLPSSVSALAAAPSSLEGVAVNSGGSIALVKDGGSGLVRLQGFNQSSPTSTPLSSVSNLNVGAGRAQDQIDLQ